MDQEENTKNMDTFPTRLWLNQERTDWEEVYPGYRIQIHGISSDPRPDIPDFYEATIEAVTRVAGVDYIRVVDHKRHNTEAAYTEPPEDIPLIEGSIRFFKIINRKKRKVPVIRRGTRENLKPTGT